MTPQMIVFLIAGAAAAAALGFFAGGIFTGKIKIEWTLRDIIGVSLIASFITVIFILFWKAIPPENEQLIVYMLGQLSGFVAGVVSSHYVNKANEDKLAEKRADTTKAAFEAVREAQAQSGGVGAAAGAERVAEAAVDEAESVKAGKP